MLKEPPDPPEGRVNRLGQTVIDDITQSDFQRTMSQDFQDVYHLFLDPEKRRELDEKDDVSRWLYMSFWLLKNSLRKLTPTRRLLLFGGLLLFVAGVFGNFTAMVSGFLVLLLILLLELKDKLLAQDELETGRAVQVALMPREHPAVPGWQTWLYTRPANEVGGDLVDYLELDDGHLGLALGDVAGKGLGAALVMATLQATLRALAPAHDDLGILGTTINRIVRRDGLPSRFVSLLYLTLAPSSGQVRLLNAGHLPPYVARRDGVEMMPKGAPALGLTAEAVYTEHPLALADGDLLLVYSDGLTEARNEAGEFFGEERLETLLPYLRTLSAEEAGRHLLDVLSDFVGAARASDDLSLVLVKRTMPLLPAPTEAPAAHDAASA